MGNLTELGRTTSGSRRTKIQFIRPIALIISEVRCSVSHQVILVAILIYIHV